MAKFIASRVLAHPSLLNFFTFRALSIGGFANKEGFRLLTGCFLAFRGFANEGRVSLSLGRVEVEKGCIVWRAVGRGGFKVGRVEFGDGSKADVWRVEVGNGCSAGRVELRDRCKSGIGLEGSIEFWNGLKTGGSFEEVRVEVKSGLKLRGFSDEGAPGFADEE